jgi:CRISPR-associated endonuclease/helicase Cas3
VWGVCAHERIHMTSAPKRLLAKSSKTPDTPRGEETLPGHTASVLAAASNLLDETAEAQLCAVGLSPDSWREPLRRGVLIAAFCHDLGKANDQFQAMVHRELLGRQAIRHEALSLLIIHASALSEWLKQGLAHADMLDLFFWAASGHHRKFPPDAPACGTGTRLSLFLAHPDFQRTLRVGAKWLDLGEPPAFKDLQWPLTGPLSPTKRLRNLEVRAKAYWETCDDEQRRFLAVVKACLIAADVAGSALPKEGKKIGQWITEAIRHRPAPGQLLKIANERLRGERPRPFQEAIAATKARVVLAQAGCGSGKTVAAYLWAAQRFPQRRLFFCYPTTGTATEGFRDYLVDPTLDAQLVHGRAGVDLDLLGVDDDGEQVDPLAALDAWSTLVTSCTVDTVLGITQNLRRGLYAWPALVNAALVFDEIHAYDERLFGALLRFLHSCRGLPCLLMTASLPQAQRLAIEKTLSELGESLEIVDGPADLEALPRYRRALSDDPWPLVMDTLGQQEKVLWVVNTVNRALDIAAEAEARGINTLVYHSRFRYEDRVRQHGRVIEAFKGNKPVLAIATQVAEMSLDLSAHLLVTDMAPISALIQRLGRLNRRSTPENPIPPKPFLVIEPDTEAPYKDQDHPQPFAAARVWLERLGAESLSQGDLARAWRDQDSGQGVAPLESAWLDGGFETRPRHLRESSPGLNVLLEDDAQAVERGEIDPVRVLIPMNSPKTKGWQTWRKVAFARVVPKEYLSYDPQRGARWKA